MDTTGMAEKLQENLKQIELPEANLILLVLGIVILIFGKRLFMLVVAAAAFYITAMAAQKYFGEASKTTILSLAAIVGLAAGVFTKMFKSVAIGIAGYTIAGYILSENAAEWGITVSSENERFLFVIGGLIGSLLVSFLLDIGLMFLSCVLGAQLILHYFQLDAETEKWLFVLLVLVGLVIQAGIMRKLLPSSKKEEKK